MRRLFVAAALAAALAGPAAAQSIEVSSSEGYAESRVPAIGWRQAVVGRQLPAGSVVATWIGAGAEMSYLGSRITLGPLSLLEVVSLASDSVALRLTEGSLKISASGLRFSIEYRGKRISLEAGEISLADGEIAVASGEAAVEGYAASPAIVPAGGRLGLFERKSGPVFGD